MLKKIKILHLEDSLKDAELIHSIIESGSIEHEYFLVDNEKDFINTLKSGNIDIILSDYALPEYSGSEALIFSKKNIRQYRSYLFREQLEKTPQLTQC